MPRPFIPKILAGALALTVFMAPAAVQSASLGRSQSAGDLGSLQVTSWRDLPFRRIIRQQFDYSCGSAALATLLRYHYGLKVDEAAVFRAMYAVGDQAKIRRVGFSLLDMKSYLKHLGIGSDGYRIGWDELAASKTPSIAVISTGPYRHFVVVKGATRDAVLIGDPATGLKVYSRPQFERVWSHVVFDIHDAGAAPGAFNRPEEWPQVTSPFGAALATRELEEQVDLPTIFQVTQLRAPP